MNIRILYLNIQDENGRTDVPIEVNAWDGHGLKCIGFLGPSLARGTGGLLGSHPPMLAVLHCPNGESWGAGIRRGRAA